MAKIQIKRGLQAAVARLELAEGELAVALDTGNVYVGTTSGKVHINPTGGTADTAERLKTPRAFSAAGDATAEAVNFDGSADVGAAPAAHTGVAASASQLGHVKPGAEFKVGGDGSLSLSTVDGGTFE